MKNAIKLENKKAAEAARRRYLRKGFHENTKSIERIARGKSILTTQFWRGENATPGECVTVYQREVTK